MTSILSAAPPKVASDAAVLHGISTNSKLQAPSLSSFILDCLHSEASNLAVSLPENIYFDSAPHVGFKLGKDDNWRGRIEAVRHNIANEHRLRHEKLEDWRQQLLPGYMNYRDSYDPNCTLLSYAQYYAPDYVKLHNETICLQNILRSDYTSIGAQAQKLIRQFLDAGNENAAKKFISGALEYGILHPQQVRQMFNFACAQVESGPKSQADHALLMQENAILARLQKARQSPFTFLKGLYANFMAGIDTGCFLDNFLANPFAAIDRKIALQQRYIATLTEKQKLTPSDESDPAYISAIQFKNILGQYSQEDATNPLPTKDAESRPKNKLSPANVAKVVPLGALSPMRQFLDFIVMRRRRTEPSK